MEMDPPPDFKIQLFPRGCQNHVRSLSIRVRALYPLKWLLNGGYGEIKNACKGLDTLNVIFEVESGSRDFGKVFSKKEDELWASYGKYPVPSNPLKKATCRDGSTIPPGQRQQYA